MNGMGANVKKMVANGMGWADQTCELLPEYEDQNVRSIVEM